MSKNQPEISLTKLAEFPSATDKRQRDILKTIKSSSKEDLAKKIKYNEAKSAIKSFMVDDNHDANVFDLKITQVQNKVTNSDTQATNKANTLLAIKNLEHCSQTLLAPYLKYKSVRGLPKEKSSKKIQGVLVHFTPDLILRKKGNDEIVGAIKIVFSKKPLTPLQAEIICGLLKNHIEKEYKIKIDLKNCFALDVFSKRGFIAPSEFTYYNTLLRKAYAKINTLWPSV